MLFDVIASLPVSRRAVVAAVAFSLLLLALVGNSVFANPFFTSLGLRTGWFGIAAVCIAGFGGATCLSRRSGPLSTTFGLFLLAMAVYMMSVATEYDPNNRLLLVLDRLECVASALVFTLWIRLALQLRAAASTGLLRRGAATGRLRQLLVGASPLEAFTVWLPAAILSIAGGGFGLEFSERRRTSDVWLSYWAWHDRTLYDLYLVWGVAVGAAGVVIIVRTARRASVDGALPGVAEVLRWAPAFMATMFLLGLALMFGTTTRVWPEAFLDFFVALLMVAFGLLIVDADAYRDPEDAFLSLRQRAVGAVSVCTLLFGALLLVPGSVSRHDLLAGLLAVGIPLSLRATTWLRHSPPLARASTPASAADVARLLSGGEMDDSEAAAPAPEQLRQARQQLERIEAADLRKLIAAPAGRGGRRNEFGDPREDSRLAEFLGAFPVSDSTVWEVRLIDFVRVVYETAVERDRLESNPKADPSRWRILALYCLERLRHVATDPAERDREQEELLRFQLWRYGRNARHGKHGYLFHGELDEMTAPELQTRLDDVEIRRPDDRCKKLIQRGLTATLELVHEEWRRRLEDVLSELGADEARSSAGFAVNVPNRP